MTEFEIPVGGFLLSRRWFHRLVERLFPDIDWQARKWGRVSRTRSILWGLVELRVDVECLPGTGNADADDPAPYRGVIDTATLA